MLLVLFIMGGSGFAVVCTRRAVSGLGGQSALVGHLEKLHGSAHIVDRHLFTHPKIFESIAEGGDDLGIVDARDPVTDLAETLDELAQCFTVLLLNGVQVGDRTWPVESSPEVGDKLLAHVIPICDGVLQKVHQP